MRTPLATLLASFLLIGGGCASYQLGNPSQPDYGSIRVAPPRNESSLPQAEAPIATALRQAIQQSGDLEFSSATTADSVLELTLLEISRPIAAALSEDVGRGRKFELVAQLSLSLRREGDSENYLIRDRTFTVRQDIFSDSGQIDAERQATPELARKIAERAAQILQEAW